MSAMPSVRMPEAQTLLIVSEGTSFGMPPLIWAWREGIWPWPACRTWPKTTCWTCSGSTPERSSAPRSRCRRGRWRRARRGRRPSCRRGCARFRGSLSWASTAFLLRVLGLIERAPGPDGTIPGGIAAGTCERIDSRPMKVEVVRASCRGRRRPARRRPLRGRAVPDELADGARRRRRQGRVQEADPASPDGRPGAGRRPRQARGARRRAAAGRRGAGGEGGAAAGGGLGRLGAAGGATTPRRPRKRW